MSIARNHRSLVDRNRSAANRPASQSTPSHQSDPAECRHDAAVRQSVRGRSPAGAYNIGFWFWELPSARSDWHSYYEYVDEIWVASEFCRRAFSCLTRLPVTRMPLVIEGLEQQAVHNRAHFGLPDSAFLFGYAFDVNSYLERKNPFALIEAFRQEFGDSTDVLLVLKLSHGGEPQKRNRHPRRAQHQNTRSRVQRK